MGNRVTGRLLLAACAPSRALARCVVQVAIVLAMAAAARAGDESRSGMLEGLLARYLHPGVPDRHSALIALRHACVAAGAEGASWLEARLARHGDDLDPDLRQLRATMREAHPWEAIRFLFERAGVPSCRDAQFVRYETPFIVGKGRKRPDGSAATTLPGQWVRSPVWSHGWRDHDAMTVLDVTVAVTELLPQPGLPTYYDGPRPDARSAPADFAEFCDHFIADPIADLNQNHLGKCAAPSRSLQACALAFWAHSRGLPDLERRLFAAASAEHDPSNGELRDCMRHCLVSGWTSERDTLAAHEGVPRQVLLSRARATWELMPESRWALRNVQHLESLVSDETATPPEASSDELEEVARRLRDTHLQYITQSGISLSLDRLRESRPRDPVIVLSDAGWIAVPKLLRQLADERPSRALAVGRRSGTWNPSIGECARLVLEVILGVDWAAPDTPAKAWERIAAAGPAAYYRGLLDSPSPENRALAARWLLKMAADEAVGLVLERATSPRETDAARLLDAVADHLEERHRETVRPLLRSSDVRTAVAAADVLWRRFRSDLAARRVRDLIRKGLSDEDALWTAIAARAIDLLADTQGAASSRLLRRLAGHENPHVRVETIEAVAAHPSDQHLDLLLNAMADRSRTGISSGFVDDMRVRDFAARSLAEMLATPSLPLDEFVVAHDASNRDRAYDNLLAWVRDHRSTIDWDALRPR